MPKSSTIYGEKEIRNKNHANKEIKSVKTLGFTCLREEGKVICPLSSGDQTISLVISLHHRQTQAQDTTSFRSGHHSPPASTLFTISPSSSGSIRTHHPSVGGAAPSSSSSSPSRSDELLASTNTSSDDVDITDDHKYGSEEQEKRRRREEKVGEEERHAEPFIGGRRWLASCGLREEVVRRVRRLGFDGLARAFWSQGGPKEGSEEGGGREGGTHRR